MRRLPALAAVACGLIATSAIALPFFPRHAAIQHSTERLGDWTLEIARNRFSENIACRLRAADHRAFYRAGAVAFRFRRAWDVGQAVYRLDGGPPRAARDDLPRLIALQVPFDRGGMDNASAGLVWIPYDRLIAANRVSIEPRRNRPPVDYHFRGLRALHDIALARGCVPESRFVER